MSDELPACGQSVYTERLRIIRRDHWSVNLICDAGAVMTIRIVPTGLSNPTGFERLLPLDPAQNTNWGAEQYEAFFERLF
jgi:hypothetical protein